MATKVFAYRVDETEADQGATGGGQSLKALIDTIGAENASIYLTHHGSASTTYTLTTSETVPSNITLVFQPGAILDGAGTLTLANFSQIQAGKRQNIFGASVTVFSANGGTIYPHWYNGATISQSIQNVLDDHDSDINIPLDIVITSDGGYGHAWGSTVQADRNAFLSIRGEGLATVIATTAITRFLNLGVEQKLNYSQIKDISFTASGQALTDAIRVASASRTKFENLNFKHADGGSFTYGITIDRSAHSGSEEGSGFVLCQFRNLYPGGDDSITGATLYIRGGSNEMIIENIRAVDTANAVRVELKNLLAFTSGSFEISVTDTITGATSGTTGVVESIVVETGTWGGGNAAGRMRLSAVDGAFQDEDLNIGAELNVASIAGDMKSESFQSNTIRNISGDSGSSDALVHIDTDESLGGSIVENLIYDINGQAKYLVYVKQEASGDIIRDNKVFNLKMTDADTQPLYVEDSSNAEVYENNSDIYRNHWHMGPSVNTGDPGASEGFWDTHPSEGVFVFNKSDRSLHYYHAGSWVSPIIFPLIKDLTNKETDGVGEDDLNTLTIVANSLSTNRGVKLLAAGTINGANDTKTIKLHFGATSWTVISAAAGDETDWRVEAEIINSSAAGQKVSWVAFLGDGTAASEVTSGYESINEDTTANVTLKLTGECAHADDTIYQRIWHVEMI